MSYVTATSRLCLCTSVAGLLKKLQHIHESCPSRDYGMENYHVLHWACR